jgi:hypothetical protein
MKNNRLGKFGSAAIFFPIPKIGGKISPGWARKSAKSSPTQRPEAGRPIKLTAPTRKPAREDWIYPATSASPPPAGFRVKPYGANGALVETCSRHGAKHRQQDEREQHAADQSEPESRTGLEPARAAIRRAPGRRGSPVIAEGQFESPRVEFPSLAACRISLSRLRTCVRSRPSLGQRRLSQSRDRSRCPAA